MLHLFVSSFSFICFSFQLIFVTGKYASLFFSSFSFICLSFQAEDNVAIVAYPKFSSGNINEKKMFPPNTKRLERKTIIITHLGPTR
jgi:hypothetical protein